MLCAVGPKAGWFGAGLLDRSAALSGHRLHDQGTRAGWSGGERVLGGSAMILPMHSAIWGEGPRVVLVHGAITNGPAAWSKQKPLAERWQLVVVNRPGFVPNPPEPRCDFEADAEAVAEIIDEPAHLVGHSYGGLIALLAASYRP